MKPSLTDSYTGLHHLFALLVMTGFAVGVRVLGKRLGLKIPFNIAALWDEPA